LVRALGGGWRIGALGQTQPSAIATTASGVAVVPHAASN